MGRTERVVDYTESRQRKMILFYDSQDLLFFEIKPGWMDAKYHPIDLKSITALPQICYVARKVFSIGHKKAELLFTVDIFESHPSHYKITVNGRANVEEAKGFANQIGDILDKEINVDILCERQVYIKGLPMGSCYWI